MAQELKDTANKIYQNAPVGLNDEYIITVGDICTMKINEQVKMPDLSTVS